MAEGWRNLSAVGARGLAITNNLNFGTPEKPEIMAQMAQSVLGMGDAARALDTPVVSGNVSLYNETDGRATVDGRFSDGRRASCSLCSTSNSC